jgi:hypothetical protein
MSTRASPPSTLHGHLLLLARLAWVAVAITALAIVLFSVPSSIEHYRSVCTAPTEVCSERALDQPTQPTQEGVRGPFPDERGCGVEGCSACQRAEKASGPSRSTAADGS